MACGSYLKLRETTLSPGAEWHFPPDVWTVLRVRQGVAYWLRPPTPRELAVGDVIVGMGDAAGLLRASQLGAATIDWFIIQPETLSGLLTWTERNRLAALANRIEFSGRFFAAGQDLAQRFERLIASAEGSDFQSRFHLL